MAAGPLTGIGVLVTRPQHQADALCGALLDAGAQVFRLPAIEIREREQGLEVIAHSGLEALHFILFTSANAVRSGAGHIGRAARAQLAAIGSATAHALRATLPAREVLWSEGATSESLLTHEALQEIKGRRMLIVTGAAGRDALADALQARGAHVTIAEVYERRAVVHPAQTLLEMAGELRRRSIHIVTATSLDIAQSLLALPCAPLHDTLLEASWVVPSQRVADGLTAAGVSGRIVQARTARDQDLVRAIAEWRATLSDA